MDTGLIALKNVEIVIHGCTDTLSDRLKVGRGVGIISVRNLADIDLALRINGREVSGLKEIPRSIEGGTIEILNEDVSMTLYLSERDELCHLYSDGEYAHIICIPTSTIMKLLKYHDVF